MYVAEIAQTLEANQQAATALPRSGAVTHSENSTLGVEPEYLRELTWKQQLLAEAVAALESAEDALETAETSLLSATQNLRIAEGEFAGTERSGDGDALARLPRAP